MLRPFSARCHVASLEEVMYRQIASRIVAVTLTANFLAVTPSTSTSGACTCHKSEKGDTTHGGANEYIVVLEEESYRELQGTVRMWDDTPIENVLIEIFDNADYLLKDDSWRKNPTQKRLAACLTGADGKFCFCHLPSGSYELRASLSDGWNVTHVHIAVDKRAGHKKHAVVYMRVGT